MKKLLFGLTVFLSLASFGATSTKVLALRLWNAIEKERNLSYMTLDSYRIHLASDSPLKVKLDDPQEFKRYQNIFRNVFIDKVAAEFSRTEITNLTKIFSRPEMTKIRLFTNDFWDDKSVSEILDTNSKK